MDFLSFPLNNVDKILHSKWRTRICMGSSKIKAQGQSQGHVTFTFMWYFLKKKTMKT